VSAITSYCPAHGRSRSGTANAEHHVTTYPVLPDRAADLGTPWAAQQLLDLFGDRGGAQVVVALDVCAPVRRGCRNWVSGGLVLVILAIGARPR